jgi:hypothetical protein
MVGAKCWDRIAEGYSILNMGKTTKVGQCTHDDDGYEGANSTMDSSKCIGFLPQGFPQGVYLYRSFRVQ